MQGWMQFASAAACSASSLEQDNVTAHELTACASHQPSPSMLIASFLTSGRLLTLGEGAWRLQEDLLHTIVAQDDDHEIDLVTFLH